jgi:hypothetical protein
MLPRLRTRTQRDREEGRRGAVGEEEEGRQVMDIPVVHVNFRIEGELARKIAALAETRGISPRNLIEEVLWAHVRATEAEETPPKPAPRSRR